MSGRVSVSNASGHAPRLPGVYVADPRPLAPARPRDLIAPVGHDVVNRTGPAHHPIVAPAIGDVDLVPSRPRKHERGAPVVNDPIVARTAIDKVVAPAAVDGVVTGPTVDEVVAGTAAN